MRRYPNVTILVIRTIRSLCGFCAGGVGGAGCVCDGDVYRERKVKRDGPYKKGVY